jgi:hypothetical protein
LLYFSRAAIYPCFLAIKSTCFLSFYISILTCALSSSIFCATISLASTTIVTSRAAGSFLRVAIINN